MGLIESWENWDIEITPIDNQLLLSAIGWWGNWDYTKTAIDNDFLQSAIEKLYWQWSYSKEGKRNTRKPPQRKAWTYGHWMTVIGLQGPNSLPMDLPPPTAYSGFTEQYLGLER